MDNCVPIALFIHSKHLEFKCFALVATKTYEQMLFHYLCVLCLSSCCRDIIYLYSYTVSLCFRDAGLGKLHNINYILQDLV